MNSDRNRDPFALLCLGGALFGFVTVFMQSVFKTLDWRGILVVTVVLLLVAVWSFLTAPE